MAPILKPTEPTPELGRVVMPNPGSQRYRMKHRLSSSALVPRNWKSKHWRLGYDRRARRRVRWQTQALTSRCVEYGETHLLLLEPIVRVDAFALTQGRGMYEWAQENDYWPGGEPTYYGTSLDAGFQFLLHEAKLIARYDWISTMDELLGRLSAPTKEGGGPVGVGTDWYTGQDVKDGNGFWHPTGDWRGGHCYTIRSHVQPTAKREGKFGTGNSHEGNEEAWMSYDEMEWLLFAQNGEAAGITELPRAA